MLPTLKSLDLERAAGYFICQEKNVDISFLMFHFLSTVVPCYFKQGPAERISAKGRLDRQLWKAPLSKVVS